MSSPASLDAQALLDKLDELERGSPTPLNGKIAKHWAEVIRDAQAFLVNRAHPIVFIGSVGVGKSSLISVLARLLVGPPPSDRASLKENSVLAIGSGRTTVCEVRIRAARPGDGGSVGLLIDPLSEPEMKKEIEIYAEEEWTRRQASAR